jgi:hypothetical protein
MRFIRLTIVGILISCFDINGQAPPAKHSATDLAKTTQNPFRDIVSVPFEFNFNSGGALKDETFFNLNFQPVIPIHISPKVTLISRTILPLDSFPGANGTRYIGNGDIQQQTFFNPAKAGKVMWVSVRPSLYRPRQRFRRKRELGQRAGAQLC